MQHLHHRARHAGRPGQAVGRGGHDGVAQLLERGHLRPALGALLAKGDQQPQLARVDERRKAVGVDAHHHLAGGHRDHLLGGAFVGHVDVGQAALAEQLVHHHVGRGAGAVGGDAQGAGVGLGVAEQVVQRFERAGRGHDDAEGDPRQLDDRRGVTDRIPQHLADPGGAQHGMRQLRQRVAVGCGLLQDRHGQRAAGAAAVLDQHLLAQLARRGFGQHAEGEVGGAARRPGQPQRDRPGRERGRRLGQRRAPGWAQRQGTEQAQASPAVAAVVRRAAGAAGASGAIGAVP